MVLRDISKCVGEVLTWDLSRGGAYPNRIYGGTLQIDNTTNPPTYQLGNANLGSLTPNEFNTANKVNNKNQIVSTVRRAA